MNVEAMTMMKDEAQSAAIPAVLPAAPPRPAPSPLACLGACGGFVALGLAAGLGSSGAAMAARTVPTGLFVGIGALLLTAPALVVVHQFLQLKARPEALLAALARGFTRSGLVALGLTPLALYFSASSRLGMPLLAMSLLGIGAIGLLTTMRDLVHAEETAEPRPANPTRVATAWGLAVAWSGLFALVALRIGWDVARFILGY